MTKTEFVVKLTYDDGIMEVSTVVLAYARDKDHAREIVEAKIEEETSQSPHEYDVKIDKIRPFSLGALIGNLKYVFGKGTSILDERETHCILCDFCVKHQIHSGSGHNYSFDSCWKCKDEIKENLK